MPDDHNPGWLDPFKGIPAESGRRWSAMRTHVDTADDAVRKSLHELRATIDQELALARVPARVYVHVSPKLSPATNYALRELVGRAIQGIGNEACRKAPDGLSVRLTFRNGAVIVEPADGC